MGWGFWGVGASPNGCGNLGAPRARCTSLSRHRLDLFAFAAQSRAAKKKHVGFAPPPLLNRAIQSLPGVPEESRGHTNSGHLARCRRVLSKARLARVSSALGCVGVVFVCFFSNSTLKSDCAGLHGSASQLAALQKGSHLENPASPALLWGFFIRQKVRKKKYIYIFTVYCRRM